MAIMARQIKTVEKREKIKISRKGRHSKRVKARDKKQTLFTNGACRRG